MSDGCYQEKKNLECKPKNNLKQGGTQGLDSIVLMLITSELSQEAMLIRRDKNSQKRKDAISAENLGTRLSR